ncbi:hypothetical protein BDV38DRAFT_248954 [Aspergillus pseudotamarii]|uniref:Uncharacterized protein n=1 Tax=Aspergillus pseudotamarii TaxID=132259 RepID=A0A5N6SU96_ASPPS|nr:uncharacterized protein BDV38DRAFT_248954 [Aspergillus pseudotamarii]KAE8136714.1 hypothetical protein BDV38DRAFT_248954 [Aspergillus pseudotamarii]
MKVGSDERSHTIHHSRTNAYTKLRTDSEQGYQDRLICPRLNSQLLVTNLHSYGKSTPMTFSPLRFSS